MSSKLDLTGLVYGRLTVIRDIRRRTKNGDVLWLCKCECGNESEVRATALAGRRILSCGCLRNDKSSDRARKRFGRIMPQPAIRYERGDIEDLEDLIKW